MPGRKYGSDARYGFNGKERDKDMHSLTAYDYGFRIYNPAIGKFLSVDPLTAKYPFYTPYSFAGNKPIQCIDLDGAEESIPYLQSVAFDQIATLVPGVNYVRGKKGDNLATTLPPKEKSDFEEFLESISPIRASPIEAAPHIAQAINFANAVGSVVYDYESSLKGEKIAITSGNEALFFNTKTVYLKISGYSEIGQEIVQSLRSSHGLAGLSDAEIKDYISSVRIVFEPGKDYSNIFWQKVGGAEEIKIVYAQIGPTAIPIPIAPSAPIVMPPLGGMSAVNTANGSLIVSINAIAQEMAATLAPGILQMSKKKGNQLLDDLPNTLEGLNELRSKIKERKTANNGKITDADKKLLGKIITQEKNIHERNKQKRKNK